MNILSHIEDSQQSGNKLLAILLDPERDNSIGLKERVEASDLIFVGGSEITCNAHNKTEELVMRLKELTNKPIILFPGQVEQFTDKADALLFLSVLSSCNYEMTIGRQIAAANIVHKSGIETIPMGYILLDGGKESSVSRMSQSLPLPQEETETIISTAIAAELMGKRLVYLEAGSGAKRVVNESVIKSVRAVVKVPLIVGGGICTTKQMEIAYKAGADIVVIGNHLEQYPKEAAEFARYKRTIITTTE